MQDKILNAGLLLLAQFTKTEAEPFLPNSAESGFRKGPHLADKCGRDIGKVKIIGGKKNIQPKTTGRFFFKNHIVDSHAALADINNGAGNRA